MKKNMLNKFLILISIFFILQNSSYANETSQEVNLQNIEIPINKKEKTKEDYEKEDDLLNPVTQSYEKSPIIKKDDVEFDGAVGVNKEAKTIDEVKVNIGTKF